MRPPNLSNWDCITVPREGIGRRIGKTAQADLQPASGSGAQTHLDALVVDRVELIWIVDYLANTRQLVFTEGATLNDDRAWLARMQIDQMQPNAVIVDPLDQGRHIWWDAGTPPRRIGSSSSPGPISTRTRSSRSIETGSVSIPSTVQIAPRPG